MKLPLRQTSLAAVTVCSLANLLTAPLARGQSPIPAQSPANTRANERRVVLIVWDGLRPDSINDTDTPTLAKLAREGVFFTRHHPVYPSMTEVNGTALATGCYPGHSGIIGNREFRPAIDPLKTVAMESIATIRKGDEATGGKYLCVPTLPELLQKARRTVAIAGTKGVAALLDRSAREGDNEFTGQVNTSNVLYEGKALPPGLEDMFTSALGKPFPTEIHFPNVEQDAWTTRALTEFMWNMNHGVLLPGLSVLWMSDPDYTQHQFGPDSPQAHRALASVDANLGTVLKELDRRHLRETTDVLVVSDHGFSTIGRAIDLAKLLADAGFNAAREYNAPPQPGDILVNGLGGSVFLYVAGHDAATIQRAVTFLQQGDYAGVIFTRDGLPGTFPLSAVYIDSADAPDIAVAMRWTDDKNAAGFPGTVVSDGGRKPGQGTHATLSRYDMRNTLIAAGPDFKVGWRDELPSGNVDLAPTIAHLLGLPNPPKMDGRVLYEAFSRVGMRLPPDPTTQRLESKQDAGQVSWSQYLQVTHYADVDYFDEGNGSAQAKRAP